MPGTLVEEEAEATVGLSLEGDALDESLAASETFTTRPSFERAPTAWEKTVSAGEWGRDCAGGGRYVELAASLLLRAEVMLAFDTDRLVRSKLTTVTYEIIINETFMTIVLNRERTFAYRGRTRLTTTGSAGRLVQSGIIATRQSASAVQ